LRLPIAIEIPRLVSVFGILTDQADGSIVL
jgi:hypothetical protein